MPHGGPHNPPSRSVFAVDEFMSKLDIKGSYAKTNRFTVEIIAPTTLVSRVQASSIEFLIKTVSFPARTFGTTTYRSGGKFGLDVPYEMTEEPVAISFLGTNDWKARKFWYDFSILFRIELLFKIISRISGQSFLKSTAFSE